MATDVHSRYFKKKTSFMQLIMITVKGLQRIVDGTEFSRKIIRPSAEKSSYIYSQLLTYLSIF